MNIIHLANKVGVEIEGSSSDMNSGGSKCWGFLSVKTNQTHLKPVVEKTYFAPKIVASCQYLFYKYQYYRFTLSLYSDFLPCLDEGLDGSKTKLTPIAR